MDLFQNIKRVQLERVLLRDVPSSNIMINLNIVKFVDALRCICGEYILKLCRHNTLYCGRDKYNSETLM